MLKLKRKRLPLATRKELLQGWASSTELIGLPAPLDHGFHTLTSSSLQMTNSDDVITTEVIEDFRLGPDETKMVEWSSHPGVPSADAGTV